VSPDRPEKLRASRKKVGLGYRLYSDRRLEAARRMGIAFQLTPAEVAQLRKYGIDIEEASGEKHHRLPVPSVFLVEKGGRILWVYSNPDYKVRPDNDTLLDAARAARTDAD